jgi:hypothetical protein
MSKKSSQTLKQKRAVKRAKTDDVTSPPDVLKAKHR